MATDTAPIPRISSPCNTGDLLTSRPLIAPRSNSHTSAAAADAEMARYPVRNRWGMMGGKKKGAALEGHR